MDAFNLLARSNDGAVVVHEATVKEEAAPLRSMAFKLRFYQQHKGRSGAMILINNNRVRFSLPMFNSWVRSLALQWCRVRVSEHSCQTDRFMFKSLYALALVVGLSVGLRSLQPWVSLNHQRRRQIGPFTGLVP